MRNPIQIDNRTPPPDGPARPRWAVLAQPQGRTFAEVLGKVSRRSEVASPRNVIAAPFLAQRSRLLQPAAMPLLSNPQVRALAGDETAVDRVPFAGLFIPIARKHGLSPALIAAVIRAESAFDPRAQSRAGAKGLMQLMDGTARSLGISNVFDPAQNLEGGTRLLSSLLGRYNGNINLALAAYNAGAGAVERYGGIPPYKETRDYVSRVLTYWQDFGGGTVP